MNKREAILSLLDSQQKPVYIPAAFFLHFGPDYQRGQAAVDKHLEFFHYTGMDFVKIQYEHNFPYLEYIQQPEDWAKVPLYKEDFFEEPLRVVQGLVKAAKSEAMVVMTLYSPFMLAGQMAGSQMLVEHIYQNPEAVRKGMEIVTQSLLNFVRGCLQDGIDGFYVSTQGGEKLRLDGTSLFTECVKPYDLAIWHAIQGKCPFNILHVCDYVDKYENYSQYLDYPGQVVNCSLKLTGRTLAPREVEGLFRRPFMGGMDRLGAIAHADVETIRKTAEAALEQAPERFILAADCTVPFETPWENLKAAIDTAHAYRKA